MPIGRVSAQGRVSFQVNDIGSGSDVAPGNGVCAASNGVCTLRAAIEEANANANLGVSITFNIPANQIDPFTGAWTIYVSPPVTLSKFSRSDLPTVSISGPGADKLIINGDTRFGNRIFNVTTAGTVNYVAPAEPLTSRSRMPAAVMAPISARSKCSNPQSHIPHSKSKL
jgi:CSLREA domain-containing protein